MRHNADCIDYVVHLRRADTLRHTSKIAEVMASQATNAFLSVSSNYPSRSNSDEYQTPRRPEFSRSR